MALNHYPGIFPIAEVGIVVNKILARPPVPSLADAAEAAWWVVGYGLNQVVPSDFNAAGENVVYTPDQVADLLDGTNGDFRKTASIPWELILPILLDLIRKWRKDQALEKK